MKTWHIAGVATLLVNLLLFVETRELPRMNAAMVATERAALMVKFKTSAEVHLKSVQEMADSVPGIRTVLCPTAHQGTQLACAVEYTQVELKYQEVVQKMRLCLQQLAEGNMEDAIKHYESATDILYETAATLRHIREDYLLQP